MIQGTLPDSWGEEYKNDTASLDDTFSAKSLATISDAVDYVLKDIRRRLRKSYQEQEDERVKFVNEMRVINEKYSTFRIKFVRGPHREDLYRDMMEVCKTWGYEGDRTYYG